MGCDKRGDGDNNNILLRSSEVVDEDEVPYTGLRTRVVRSTDRIRISRQQLKASRRVLKKLNLLRTEAEEKWGSVPNKDVGESSEIVVENLNPGADSSAINVASAGVFNQDTHRAH